MCFNIEAVDIIYLVTPNLIHRPWHKAMILSYNLTDTFYLTLNNLVTSVEDDFKV